MADKDKEAKARGSESGGGSFNANMFPDAEKRTIEFYCNTNLKALRRVLERALTIPEIEHDAQDVWDDAKVHFPKLFGRSESPPGPMSFDALLKMLAYRMDLELPLEPVPVIIDPESGETDVLQCQFCGKVVNSTSGRTLHEKVCKSRPVSP